jgi:hypothetical protein
VPDQQKGRDDENTKHTTMLSVLSTPSAPFSESPSPSAHSQKRSPQDDGRGEGVITSRPDTLREVASRQSRLSARSVEFCRNLKLRYEKELTELLREIHDDYPGKVKNSEDSPNKSHFKQTAVGIECPEAHRLSLELLS